MAKIKNMGAQPRGFIQEDGSTVTVRHGEEADVNMTEADFNHLKKVMENADDPKPFEISGSHSYEAKKKEKNAEDEAHSPAQSTEPPPSQPHQENVPPVTITPQTEREKRERQEAPSKREETSHRGR